MVGEAEVTALTIKGWQQENAELQDEIARLRTDRDRLLVLATKHCDRNHHDWQEILKIADDCHEERQK